MNVHFTSKENSYPPNYSQAFQSFTFQFPESYLGGEEGPAVGGGASAAGAAAVVRHRPRQAQLGTARCRLSFRIFPADDDRNSVLAEHAGCIPCTCLVGINIIQMQ